MVGLSRRYDRGELCTSSVIMLHRYHYCLDSSSRNSPQAHEFGDVAVAEVDLAKPFAWKGNLGDFRSQIQRHRPDISNADP